MTEAEIDWDLVRADYEGGDETVLEIAQKYGTTTARINVRKHRDGWIARNRGRSTRRDILARVYRILDGQTRKMEMAMDDGKETYGMSDLANVTRTLEKLIVLNRTEDKRKRNPPESAVMKALREKLADRIDQLNQG